MLERNGRQSVVIVLCILGKERMGLELIVDGFPRLNSQIRDDENAFSGLFSTNSVNASFDEQGYQRNPNSYMVVCEFIFDSQ